MVRKRNRIAWVMCTFALLVLLAMVGMYALNPFGVDSFDPRERIVGYGIYRVPAAGMSPAIEAGDVVFGKAGYYKGQVPARGDIVVLRVPGRGIRVIKRIVGLPGERIAIRGGKAEIDGRRLAEPYVVATNAAMPYSREMPSFLIPEGAWFVLGDNRDSSEDSRIWGVVGRIDLQARVVAR